MRTLSLMAACSALALMAAPNDQGGDPTAALARQAEEEAAAAAKKAEEDSAAEAAAAAAQKAEEEAAAKKAEKEAAAARKGVLVIWVQPGHERYFIGQAVEVPASDAEFLRSAGRAREATKDEVKAWKAASKAAD